MTSVYVVEGWTPYGGSEVFGVYSTKELAESRLVELRSSKIQHYEYYDSTEYILDAD